MKAAVARLQHVQGIHGDPAVVEQLKVPVSVPTGPMVKRKFTLVPSHDVEIYLLIFCVSVRFTLGVFSCLRHVLFNPDVNVSRYRRKTPSWERYNREDGEMFSHNRHHLANLRPNPVNMSPDAGKLDFVFTANGCGTAAMPISASAEFQECCNWHDACYSTCGMKKAKCEKRLEKCMKSKCNEIVNPSEREECHSTAKLFSFGANMIACPAYQESQKEACECVATNEVADANRARLVHFLTENGAPEEELENQEIDDLLAKYGGQEPTMFLRLLKKYPNALKPDPKKNNFMDDVMKNAGGMKEETKKKMKEKEILVDEHVEL
ncbi:hypothetical protein JM16_009154 [Phytophthora kernoviae]|uniref:Phospholipase A2 domain-containing protein n=3 Tax=Phytophthora kernoviae TaxID=325452 RepID=A0A8T0LJU6_9STRA|nr:hypothetical protein JM16_009154 [Phytophthora kernoviae]